MSPHDELRALLQRYARAVDGREVDALAALFTGDAVVVGARGDQTIEAWLESMRAPRAFPTSMHVLGDPLIELDVERGTAVLDTYAVVYQLGDQAAAQGDLTLGIRYVDDAIDDGGVWRIRRRTATTLWMR